MQKLVNTLFFLISAIHFLFCTLCNFIEYNVYFSITMTMMIISVVVTIINVFFILLKFLFFIFIFVIVIFIIVIFLFLFIIILLFYSLLLIITTIFFSSFFSSTPSLFFSVIQYHNLQYFMLFPLPPTALPLSPSSIHLLIHPNITGLLLWFHVAIGYLRDKRCGHITFFFSYKISHETPSFDFSV